MTIFNWEKGKARPMRKQLAAWGAVKKLGKRAAMQLQETLKGKPNAAKTRPHRRRWTKTRHKWVWPVRMSCGKCPLTELASTT